MSLKQEAPIAESENQNAEQLTEEQFLFRVRDGYKRMFEELRDRSVPGAKMNYKIAANYDKKVFRLECLAAAGTVFGTPFVLSDRILPLLNLNKRIGIVAAVFAAGVIAIESIPKGSKIILPLFSDRASDHIKAAAGWQALELKIRKRIIQLEDPTSNVEQYAEWCSEIIEERRKLCLVYIPQDVYKEYHSKEDKETSTEENKTSTKEMKISTEEKKLSS